MMNNILNHTSRYVALFFAFFFLYFTVVQYNDPDKSLWIFIYLMAFAVSMSAVYGKHDIRILLVMAAASMFAAFDLFPYGHYDGVALKLGMKTDEVEVARESFGFAIIALSSLYYLFIAFRNRKKKLQ